MVRTRRTVTAEKLENTRDINQLILERLEQQQKIIEEMRATQAQSEQDRDAAIVTAVAAAVNNMRPPEPSEAANPAAERVQCHSLIFIYLKEHSVALRTTFRVIEV